MMFNACDAGLMVAYTIRAVVVESKLDSAMLRIYVADVAVDTSALLNL